MQKVIDITMVMGSWTFPGDRQLQLEGPYSAIGEEKEFCYNFGTNSVDGTHIQAPHYILKNGKTVDQFPIESFRKEAVLIDLTNNKGPFMDSGAIHKETEGCSLKGKAVIFRTGIMDKLIAGEDAKDLLLKMEDAQFLMDRGITMIVIDTTCLDDFVGSGGEAPVTRFFCEHDVLLVKQVCNLSAISKREVIVEAYPLKINGISGTPCRAVVLE